MPFSASSTRTRLTVVAVIVGLLMWFYGAALFSDQSFVYRDVAHFYYPLFEWSQNEWSAGRVPLWNPLENCGVPAMADATSSVWYPGKLIFLLPLSFPLSFKLYLCSHSLFAALGAYWLARAQKSTELAAAACALAYAFGGVVLFQYCNVVFLVGAAWLPIALLAAQKALVKRSAWWAIAFGAVLAVMTLGGDPQAAYHAGLAAALYALLLWHSERQARRNADPTAAADESIRPSRWRRCLRFRPLLLAIAAASGGLLAAVQILPSYQWTQQSERAAFTAPRTLYEIPTSLRRESAPGEQSSGWAHVRCGLLSEPQDDTHHAFIYEFSVPPWQFAELLWPNFSGRTFPTHRRWTAAIPAQGRVWAPSLYMGLLPLLLGLAAWRLRGGMAEQRWFSWLALLAALGSLGWYGLGWLLHEVRCGLGADPQDIWFGGPVGGLYWLMVVALPGYVYFRFPAKLLVVVVLALSILAARGWDRAFQQKSKAVVYWLAVVAVLSFVALFAVLVLRFFWTSLMAGVAADSYFGPLDAWGAASDLLSSVMHGLIVSLVLLGLLVMCFRSGGGRARVLAHVALVVTALDLAVANHWLLPTAPQEIWRRESPITDLIHADHGRADEAANYRVYRGVWHPPAWRETISADRQAEAAEWDRQTLFPKYNLPAGVAFVETGGTLFNLDYALALRVARDHGPQQPNGTREPHASVLRALSTRHLLLPNDSDYADAAVVVPETQDDERLVPDVRMARLPDEFPRAWIVHQVERMTPLKGLDPVGVARRTREVLFPGGRPRDFRSTAVVEAEEVAQLELLDGKPSDAAGEACRVTVDEPQRVVIDVQLHNAGLVVLNDLYYPGWEATLETQSSDSPTRVPILRTNRIMRGVVVPAGKHRITFRYRPRSFYAGATVSAIAWLLLAAMAIASICRRRPVPDR